MSLRQNNSLKILQKLWTLYIIENILFKIEAECAMLIY
jgi:hypothetical protein